MREVYLAFRGGVCVLRGDQGIGAQEYGTAGLLWGRGYSFGPFRREGGTKEIINRRVIEPTCSQNGR